MSTIACPHCGRSLTARQMNLDQGVALCDGCGKLTRLIDLLPPDESAEAEAALPPADLAQVPPRCTLQGLPGNLTATFNLRSLATAGGALFFAIFWNSIVLVFLTVALGSLLQRLGVPVPVKAVMPWYMSLFMLLFLTPFIAVGVAVIVAAAGAVFGEVRLEVIGRRATLTQRHRLWGRVKRFHLDEVIEVKVESVKQRFTPQTHATSSRRPTKAPEVNLLAIHTAAQVIRFGHGLTREERHWLRTLLETLAFRPDDAALHRVLGDRRDALRG